MKISQLILISFSLYSACMNISHVLARKCINFCFLSDSGHNLRWTSARGQTHVRLSGTQVFIVTNVKVQNNGIEYMNLIYKVASLIQDIVHVITDD